MKRLLLIAIVCVACAAATLRASDSAQTLPVPKVAKSAPLNGIELYYAIYGEGNPLLLLHGFGGAHTAWNDAVPDLAKRHRVIAVDLRGHGKSTNPSNEFTHRQSAKDIIALLDHLGLKTVRALGISTGGMTLLHVATQQPDRIEAMVLIGATIYFPEEARVIMRRSTVESLSAEQYERGRQMHARGDEQTRALRAQFHAFKDSYEDMNFTPPLLSTIRARTLIVHGDRDQFFPVSIPVEMYRAIPGSSLWIVPNGGHVPIWGARKTEFLRVVEEFLQQPVR